MSKEIVLNLNYPYHDQMGNAEDDRFYIRPVVVEINGDDIKLMEGSFVVYDENKFTMVASDGTEITVTGEDKFLRDSLDVIKQLENPPRMPFGIQFAVFDLKEKVRVAI